MTFISDKTDNLDYEHDLNKTPSQKLHGRTWERMLPKNKKT